MWFCKNGYYVNLTSTFPLKQQSSRDHKSELWKFFSSLVTKTTKISWFYFESPPSVSSWRWTSSDTRPFPVCACRTPLWIGAGRKKNIIIIVRSRAGQRTRSKVKGERVSQRSRGVWAPQQLWCVWPGWWSASYWWDLWLQESLCPTPGKETRRQGHRERRQGEESWNKNNCNNKRVKAPPTMVKMSIKYRWTVVMSCDLHHRRQLWSAGTDDADLHPRMEDNRPIGCRESHLRQKTIKNVNKYTWEKKYNKI